MVEFQFQKSCARRSLMARKWLWACLLATLLLVILAVLLIVLLPRRHTDHQHPLGIKALYQFGDSLSDTGNYIRDSGSDSQFTRLPYGQTYFNRPTGRCSDGLLIIDYLAQYFKLPFLDPYLKKDGNFNHGVNFAVAASTALNVSTLASNNISPPSTNKSLSVQVDWFKSYLDSICDSPSDCKNKLRDALFVMGEIGGNDVNYALSKMKGMEDRRKFVLEVVQANINAVKEIINLGAVRVIVPGNLPIGCMPIYLFNYKTDNLTMYDELKCLKDMNAFAKFQNDKLQQGLKELQREHPHVAVVYGDLFHAMKRIISSANALGFDKDATLKTCCGSGDNAYNYNSGRVCGYGASVCSNPDSRISWDGIHLTSHANQHMAQSLQEEIVSGMSHLA